MPKFKQPRNVFNFKPIENSAKNFENKHLGPDAARASPTSYVQQKEIEEKLNEIKLLFAQEPNFKSLVEKFIESCNYSTKIESPKVKEMFLSNLVDIYNPISDKVFLKLQKAKEQYLLDSSEQVSAKEKITNEKIFNSFSFLRIENNKLIFNEKVMDYLICSYWLYSYFGNEKTALKADSASTLIGFYLPLYYQNSVQNLMSLEQKPIQSEILDKYFVNFYFQMFQYTNLLLDAIDLQLKINPKFASTNLEFLEGFYHKLVNPTLAKNTNSRLNLIYNLDDNSAYAALKNEREQINMRFQRLRENIDFATKGNFAQSSNSSENVQSQEAVNNQTNYQKIKEMLKKINEFLTDKISSSLIKNSKIPKTLNFISNVMLGFSLTSLVTEFMDVNLSLSLIFGSFLIKIASKIIQNVKEEGPKFLSKIGKLSFFPSLVVALTHIPLTKKALYQIGVLGGYILKSIYEPLLYIVHFGVSVIFSVANSPLLFGLPAWFYGVVLGAFSWFLGSNLEKKIK